MTSFAPEVSGKRIVHESNTSQAGEKVPGGFENPAKAVKPQPHDAARSNLKMLVQRVHLHIELPSRTRHTGYHGIRHISGQARTTAVAQIIAGITMFRALQSYRNAAGSWFVETGSWRNAACMQPPQTIQGAACVPQTRWPCTRSHHAWNYGQCSPAPEKYSRRDTFPNWVTSNIRREKVASR
jgi:hypothetical protein